MANTTKTETASKTEAAVAPAAAPTAAPEKAKPSIAAKLETALESFEQHYAKEIEWRVRAGLTREQAITVIRAQIRHDKAE